MASQFDLDLTYMEIARLHASLSKAKRLKVGACLVTSNDILICGYNGTPKGWDNECELDDITKPSVIHAELNTILKSAKEGVSVLGATLYLTHSPCQSCCAMIAQSGIKRVIYEQKYRDTSCLIELLDSGVEVFQL